MQRNGHTEYHLSVCVWRKLKHCHDRSHDRGKGGLHKGKRGAPFCHTGQSEHATVIAAHYGPQEAAIWVQVLVQFDGK